MDIFVKPAPISQQQGVPYSNVFEDVYFSRDGGCQESDYVFLQQNNLPARWQTSATHKPAFIIAETGFGTGLNFFLTLKRWLTTTDRQYDELHYIASEKHPFNLDDFIQITEALFAQWPELLPDENALLDQYPSLTAGFHQIVFGRSKVTLNLMFGDNTAMFSQLVLPEDGKVDAWYLDGFAPGRNPEMWTDVFFRKMASLSQVGTTFSTFTAAGAVRRELERNGFTVQKKPGYGRKREMLAGQFNDPSPRPDSAPWFALPDVSAEHTEVMVIGAGLAGSAVANRLVLQGKTVSVLERNARPAQEASGNLAGVIYPPMSQQASAEYDYFAQAYQSMVQWLEQDGVDWHPCGVLQIAQDEKQLSRYRVFAGACHDKGFVREVSNAEAGELAGVELMGEGVFFPQGGYLNPQMLCEYYLAHASIQCEFDSEVVAIEPDDEGWKLTVHNRQTQQSRVITAKQVVIANANEVSRLLPEYSDVVMWNRGQVSYLPETSALSALQCVLCHSGYATPVNEGVNVIGATVDDTGECEVRIADHAANLEQLNAMLASAASVSLDPETLQGNVGFRTVTKDHLPLVGPVPDMAFYREHYHDLHHGRPVKNYPEARYLSGLYISVAHGARGISSSLLAAEIISATMMGTPLPVPKHVYHGVHPARYLIRELKRS